MPEIAKGVCYGQSDIDVAASFDDELALLRAKLPLAPDVVIYSSPSRRCLQLASAIAGNRPVQQDARLMELHFGEWELRHWDDIPRAELDNWANAYVEHAPPGGESFRAMHGRVAAFLHALTETACEAPVVIVTHAGVIRAMLAEALQLPLTDAFRFHLDFGSVTQLLLRQALEIGYVNR